MRSELGRELLGAMTFEQLLAVIGRGVQAAAGYSHAWLLVAEDDAVTRLRVLDPRGGFTDAAWDLAPVLVVAADPVLAEVVAGDRIVVVDDSRTDPRTDKHVVATLGHRTVVHLPLWLGDRLFGVACTGTFGDDGCRSPTEAQLAALRAMASPIALATAELRFALAAMRASEGRFRTVIATAHEGFIEMDAEGRIAEWNPEAEAIFGWSRADVIGRKVADTVIPPPLRDAHGRGLQRYLATGDGPILGKRLELTAQHRDGRTFPVELTVSAIREAGAPRFAAFVRDITDRRQAEELLARARDDAEQAMREYEAFSYSVAHDLRAPLRAIDGFSKIVVEDHAAQLDAEGVRLLGRVREAAQHMAQLIEDLLELAKVGRTDLRRQRVDLSALAREVITRLRGDGARSVEVMIADDLICDGDSRLLAVVLDNLLGNAWKFTRKRADARIELGRDAADGTNAFFVRDNGAGFDMAYASKLFGVFQRLHHARDFEGTGIGLATVQRIIRKHGGRVWATSAVGQGATFYFTVVDGA